MTWLVSGDRVGTVLAVSDSGVPICHGEGQHEPLPPGINDFGGNINRTLLARLQKAKCAWTVALPNEAPIHVDGSGQGLLERVTKTPEKSHGMITFFPDPDLVAIVIVVPETAFVHIRRLLELVITSESLRYSFAFEFLGFRVPHATNPAPTWEEFIAGKPYFFHEITVAVKHE